MIVKVKHIAAKYGLKEETVRNLCYSRGQRFATRLVPRGQWYINDELFEEYWQRKQQATRERRI